jgi:hypothetical protein
MDQVRERKRDPHRCLGCAAGFEVAYFDDRADERAALHEVLVDVPCPGCGRTKSVSVPAGAERTLEWRSRTTTMPTGPGAEPSGASAGQLALPAGEAWRLTSMGTPAKRRSLTRRRNVGAPGSPRPPEHGGQPAAGPFSASFGGPLGPSKARSDQPAGSSCRPGSRVSPRQVAGVEHARRSGWRRGQDLGRVLGVARLDPAAVTSRGLKRSRSAPVRLGPARAPRLAGARWARGGRPGTRMPSSATTSRRRTRHGSSGRGLVGLARFTR